MTVKVNGFQGDDLKVAGVVGLPDEESIKAGETKYLYVVLQRLSADGVPTCKIQQKLSFTITEIDVDTEDEVGSYEEDYNLSDAQIVISDYIKPEILPTGQFREQFESLGSNPKCAEVVQTYQLPYKSMEDAVEGVTKIFGMAVCEGSNKINVTDKAHNLMLCGSFLAKELVVVRAVIGFNSEYGCVLKVYIRSLSQAVSNALSECV